MRRIIISLIAIISAIAIAQTYNMQIRLKSGAIQSIPTDDIEEVSFTEVQSPGINILTMEYIPDAVLLAAVKEQVANDNETLTSQEASQYTGALEISSPELKSLEGLQYLTGLTELRIYKSGIADADLSPLKNLNGIYFEFNGKLKSINVEGLTNLEVFHINYNYELYDFDLASLPPSVRQLDIKQVGYDKLDLSTIPYLETLNCSGNSLTSIELPNNVNIRTIDCSSNNLNRINVSGCANLEVLTASFNSDLERLNIEGCIGLKTLAMMDTRISSVDVQPFASTINTLSLSNTLISVIDLSGCTELERLQLNGTQISEEIDMSSCSKLSLLRVENTNIPSLDLSNSPLIRELQCYDVPAIKSVKLASKLPNLFQINIWNAPKLTFFEWGETETLMNANILNTSLERIDISKLNQDFSKLDLENEEMKEIKVWPEFDIQNPPTNIAKLPATQFVYSFTDEEEPDNNILTEEYIPDPVLLEAVKSQIGGENETLSEEKAAEFGGSLTIPGKDLQSLEGLQYFTGITKLTLTGSSLASMDFTALTNLQELSIESNYSLVDLNISNLKNLVYLNINNDSGLKEMDFYYLPKSIEKLYMNYVRLEEFDPSDFNKLKELKVNSNALTVLDVSNNPNLEILDCGSNEMFALNLNFCSKLKNVNAGNNYGLEILMMDETNSLETVVFNNTGISSIDIQSCASTLVTLNLSNTRVSSLDLNGCVNLQKLQINDTQITGSPDFSDCGALTLLRTENTGIQSLDLKACKNLTELQCYNVSEITSVCLAEELPALKTVNLYEAPKLNVFDWGAATQLNRLTLQQTSLEYVDISEANKEAYFDLSNNNLLKEVKVWSDFDMNNPSSRIQIPSTAKFVYNFTKE